jgi:hypothetical protein
LTKLSKMFAGERCPLQHVVLGKLDIHMEKTETRSLPLTWY